MAAVNQGEVPISLNGDDLVLRSSLRAAKEVNARFGSFAEAYRGISNLDFSAYVAVVAAGTGKAIKDVEAGVYANGLPDLVEPLSTFLNLLANGGRPATPDDAEKTPKGEG